jgi:hypothetical protein
LVDKSFVSNLLFVIIIVEVIQDLNRRGETHNAWMGASESNDNDLLAIKRMEFRGK